MNLADKCKYWENHSQTSLMRGLPIIARLDGRSFHNFTKDMERPYDKRMSDLMISTATFLLRETSSLIAYTQSDEITLVYNFPENTSKGSVLFDGRVQKMVSTLAASATLFLNRNLQTCFESPDLEKFANRCPTLDCRVFSTPSESSAVDVLL